MSTLRQLVEEVREMVEFGASESDLLQKLKPYHDAYIEKVELSWKINPDRMGGQFTEREISDTGWY